MPQDLDFYKKIQLTKRLQETLQLVAEGKSDVQIGGILGISFDTAHGYRKDLRAIFDAHCSTQLVIKAVLLGFIDTDKIWGNTTEDPENPK